MQAANVAAENAKQAHLAALEARKAGTAKIDEARSKFGVTVADEVLFQNEHKAKQVTTPWFPPQAQRIRDDVFISAIALHRAFVDAAAKPIRHNLGAFINTLAAAPFPTAAKEQLLPDLWSSLFLVVPLISTTFASVNRMLGRLPRESLGWLFVDEAGQASPQSAVGALMRAKRVLIVGDPAQVEPVVMLPDSLTNAICLRFGVDPDNFGAPSASVQTLADSASTYKSEFPTRVGGRIVGAPLLVHRRCAEPMFSTSNSVAYAGLMVSATPPRESRIREILGPSRWLNIRGSGEDKWSQEEGERALLLLRRLAEAGVKPDIYLVTPFVIVADRLRQLIRASGILQAWQINDDWRWTAERVGTIHTVQGREAEAVILVLGAPLVSQTGARGWAGSRPNLLNVAVTRAKEVLYVIGNRELWEHAGVFTELASRLPSDDA
jgi:superfamily I DNA and/or RNA helicase